MDQQFAKLTEQANDQSLNSQEPEAGNNGIDALKQVFNEESNNDPSKPADRCVYHGPMPPDFLTKNLPLGTIDANGNCTFNWKGQTYIEGQGLQQGVKPRPGKQDDGPGSELRGGSELQAGSETQDAKNKIDSKKSSGNEKEWTEEEMKNAKPTPLPMLDQDGKIKEHLPHYLLNEEQKNHIENYLEENHLNYYGDPVGSKYGTGTPLFNGESGQQLNRYDYILNKLWNEIKLPGPIVKAMICD